jgi:hypothetical protein
VQRHNIDWKATYESKVTNSLDALHKFLQLSVSIKAGLSISCSGYQVVPGSEFDFAYTTSVVSFQPYDTTYCGLNSHPNSVIAIYRDNLTAARIARIYPWGWAGISQEHFGWDNDSVFGGTRITHCSA